MKGEHGEVCPAKWREGGKTVRGDPIAKLDYFAAVDGQHGNGKATGKKRVRVDEQDVRGGWGVVVCATRCRTWIATFARRTLTDNENLISSDIMLLLLYVFSRRYCTLCSMVQNFEI